MPPNKQKKVTYSRQLSTVYLFGMTSSRLTPEQIENRLYITEERLSNRGIISEWDRLICSTILTDEIKQLFNIILVTKVCIAIN